MCINFTDASGYGNCNGRIEPLGNQFVCYTRLPSSCTDLVESKEIPGKKLSAEACQMQSTYTLSIIFNLFDLALIILGIYCRRLSYVPQIVFQDYISAMWVTLRQTTVVFSSITKVGFVYQ